MSEIERELVRKLQRIEALFERPGSAGEQAAAQAAMQRIHERLLDERSTKDDQPVEYSFTVPDPWRRRLLMALLRRYRIEPYRYRRQRQTTLMAKVSKNLVDGTIWPQYEAMSRELVSYLEDATRKVISEVLQADPSEAQEVDEPRQLSFN
jgi:hypothetical protein